MLNPNKRIIDLTVAEFFEMIESKPQPEEEIGRENESEYLHGIGELADFLKMSYASTHRLYSLGRFDNAVVRLSRKKLMFNKSKLFI